MGGKKAKYRHAECVEYKGRKYSVAGVFYVQGGFKYQLLGYDLLVPEDHLRPCKR